MTLSVGQCPWLTSGGPWGKNGLAGSEEHWVEIYPTSCVLSSNL